MIKILDTYRTKPTYKNAQRVRAYERAHMMSVCMLPEDYRATLADAIYHANQGFPRP